jgi:hypothetical protein
MRTALFAVAAALSLTMTVPALAQQTPPIEKNNDASVGGATRSPGMPQGTPGRTLENRTPEDLRGSAAPESGPATNGTTTGSPPGAVDNAIETETGLGSVPLMDNDESEAARNRAPRGQRR